MPNWVTATCRVTGQDLTSFNQEILSGNIPFDFNAIIPMPPILEEVISPVRMSPNNRIMLKPDLVHQMVGLLEMEASEEQETEIRNLGFISWYEWSITNWGTKWDAKDVEIDYLGKEASGFRFMTAWSFPTPIFHALSDRYPDLVFECHCFDEGWCFAGKGQFGTNIENPFETCEATAELYEIVYDEKYEEEE